MDIPNGIGPAQLAQQEYKLKIETEHRLKSLMEELMRYFGTNRNCINCRNWSPAEVCRLVNERPPAFVIVKGCKSWSQDAPF